MKALWLGALGLAAQAFATLPNQMSPSDVLSGIENETILLTNAIAASETQRPLTVQDVELASPKEERLSLRLADLYRRTLDGKAADQVTFTRWPKLLTGYAKALRQSWERNAGLEALQDGFYAFQLGYSRSLVTAYVALEITKQRYLVVSNPAESADYRAATQALLQEIHFIAQRMLRWVHTMRFDDRFKRITIDSPYYVGPWENRWADVFFYDGRPVAKRYDAWANAISLGRWLQVLEPRIPEPNEAVLTPPGQPIPPARVDPPPPSSNEPSRTPAPPVASSPVSETAQQTRDRVIKIVDRLQTLLEKPEIQRSEEMKRVLEELIDQLRSSV